MIYILRCPSSFPRPKIPTFSMVLAMDHNDTVFLIISLQLLEEAKSAERFMRENLVQAVKTGSENVYSKFDSVCCSSKVHSYNGNMCIILIPRVLLIIVYNKLTLCAVKLLLLCEGA